MTVTSRCKDDGCNRKIAWVKIIKEDGTPGVIPLDVVAPCYSFKMNDKGEMVGTREYMSYVSHFTTCPGTNKFSKGG